jgi:hypothetical protein
MHVLTPGVMFVLWCVCAYVYVCDYIACMYVIFVLVCVCVCVCVGLCVMSIDLSLSVYFLALLHVAQKRKTGLSPTAQR